MVARPASLRPLGEPDVALSPRRARRRVAVALALHLALGVAIVAALDRIEAAQDDLFALCVVSMWLCACLLPFVVTAP